MMIKVISLSLIVFAVIIIILGIVKVHSLPGRIAHKRGHPQAEAIHILSLLGLIMFPLWMLALVWSYMIPLKTWLPQAPVLGEPVKPEGETE